MVSVKKAAEQGNESLQIRMGAIQGSFSYKETAYHLPVTFALTGNAVNSAKEAQQAYGASAHNPLVAAECLLASESTQRGEESPPFTGFIPDAVLRTLGYSLVDGSILGLVLVTGTPPAPDTAAGLCRELQEKYMLTFLSGDIIMSLISSGVKVGAEYRLVPLGSRPFSAIHFIDIIARVAMMFGGVTPGD